MTAPTSSETAAGSGRPWARWLLLAVIVAAVAAFFALGFDEQLSLQQIQQQRAELADRAEARPLAASALYFGVYVLVTALSLPGAAVLSLLGAAIFGFWWALVLVSFASSLGATLAFLAARFVLGETVEKRLGRRLARVQEGVRRDGAFYLATLRLVPIFPFWLINIAMGLTPIRVATFYGVSQLAMLPGTAVYVNAGTQLATIDSLGGLVSPRLLTAFALLGLLPLLAKFAVVRWKRRRALRGWSRPRSFDYDLIAIGAGSAGLVTSYIGATVRSRTALIERERMGGDCLNTGCVPSKALIRSARVLRDAARASHYGLRDTPIDYDFGELMDRVHRAIAAIEPHDSPERYRGLGVDVILDEARLVSPWEVEVGGRRLSARSIVLATGAEPLVPPIPGLDTLPILTSDNLWQLRERPPRLVVLGGGPIGCEMAQAFARLGSQVTVVEMGDRLLGREDPEVSAHVAGVFGAEGVDLRLGHRAVRVEAEGGAGAGRLVAETAGREVEIPFDRLLVALGRRARTRGMGFEAVGIEIAPQGTIAVDEHLRTSIPTIYACGDAAGPWQFTHTAAHQAWYAAVNGLLDGWWSFKVDDRVIPWCTFTDPEVARVGLNETEAREQGVAVEVTRYDFEEFDRAITDGATRGFVKVLTVPGRDEILGVSIVGEHAGELLAEWVLAIKHGIGLNKLLGTIHVYPTWAESAKYTAGVWKQARKPERLLALAERLWAWRRG